MLTKSLKKKLAITYNIKAPKDIEATATRVPIHLPNKIPEIIKNIALIYKERGDNVKALEAFAIEIVSNISVYI